MAQVHNRIIHNKIKLIIKINLFNLNLKIKLLTNNKIVKYFKHQINPKTNQIQ